MNYSTTRVSKFANERFYSTNLANLFAMVARNCYLTDQNTL